MGGPRSERASPHRRLVLGQVLARGATLRTLDPALVRDGLPVDIVSGSDDEPIFPEPLESLYQESLVLRVSSEDL